MFTKFWKFFQEYHQSVKQNAAPDQGLLYVLLKFE